MKLFNGSLECLILLVNIEYQTYLFIAFYVVFALYIIHWKGDK